MSILAKKGLFAVSLCALSVSSALYASATQYVTVGNDTQKITKEPGIVSSVFHVTDKDGKVISQKVHRRFEKERYIVELHNTPLIKAKREIKQSVAKQFSNSKASAATQESIIRSQLQQAQARIETDQQATIQQIQSINKSIKLLSRFSRTSNAIVIEADKTSLNAIKQLPNVKRVSPDTIKSIDLSESVSLVNAPLIWAMTDANSETITGKGISVAILDTGIDYNHVDLGGCLGENCRITHGYDFVNNDNDPMDGHGHGTHVAGIVGANGTLKGVAPGVTFHAYKVLSDYGSGATSGIIAALERSVDPDGDINTDDAVDIVNMSLGGPGGSEDPLNIATNNAVDAGVIVVVAAGNDWDYGTINKSSPASAENAITVASSTKYDGVSPFSSKALTTNNFNKPEITAPGSDINSTMPNGEYGYNSGTSMAAPHVAGAIALLKQNDPNLTPEKATQLLAAGAVDIGSDPLAQGPGRMDINASINATSTTDATAIGFGSVNTDLESWNNQQSLTVFNHSDTEKSYQVSFANEFPQGVSISASESSFTIAANSSHTLSVDLEVADTSTLEYAQTKAGIHHSKIFITTENQELVVPTYFEHALKFTLTTNSPSTVIAYVVEPDGQPQSVLVSSYQPANLIVTDPNIWIGVFYNYVDSENIPVSNTGNVFVNGASTHQLDITNNREFHLDYTQVNKFAGLTKASHVDGTDAINDISATSSFLNLHQENYSVNSVSFGGTNNNYFLARGDIATGNSVDFNVQYKIDEPLNDNNIESRYSRTKTYTESSENDLYELDMSITPYITVDLSHKNSANHYSFRENIVGISVAGVLPETVSSIKIFESEEADELSFKEFKTALIDEQHWHDKAHSVFFDLNNEGFLRTSTNRDDYIKTATAHTSNVLDLSNNKVYFNGAIYINENNISIYNADWYRNFIYSDLLGNAFDHQADYTFYCENEDGSRTVLKQDTFTIHDNDIEKPTETCNNLFLSLSYKSSLSNDNVTSHMTFNVSDLGSVPPIDKIKLRHGDEEYTHPVINKIDSTITLESSWWLALESVEMRLNSGDWLPLNFIQDENGVVSIPLTLVEGEHIADLRINTLTSQSNTYSHTLTNFFTLGTTAGEINDADNDGIPNDQDPDDDNDGYNDEVDAFPYNSQEWLDSDGDGLGDNADTDDDNDGYLDTEDAFPLDPTEWLDTDGDGIGDNADTDDDNDGYLDTEDAFPLDPTEWLDTDGDGIGNNADTDDDGDGHQDEEDTFPLDPSEWIDTDGDGIGNNADIDDDNDGYLDDDDAFPLDATEWLDTDGDGIGNNADNDDDNDGVNDNEDAFPLDASESVDTDGDGIGNNADTDDDNDGVNDAEDAFPLDAAESVDTDGDGIGNNADTDDDGDGVSDAQDAYPLDASRSSAPDNNAAENTSSSSGGSLPLIGLFALISITLRRFRRK